MYLFLKTANESRDKGNLKCVHKKRRLAKSFAANQKSTTMILSHSALELWVVEKKFDEYGTITQSFCIAQESI